MTVLYLAEYQDHETLEAKKTVTKITSEKTRKIKEMKTEEISNRKTEIAGFRTPIGPQ